MLPPSIERVVVAVPPFKNVLAAWRKYRIEKSIRSPQYKRDVIRQLAQTSGIKTFIETGTFRGDMLAAVAEFFDQLYSIELSEQLYTDAVARFKNQPKFTLLQGDSGEALGVLLGRITTPAMFWLDGHYSGSTTGRGIEDTPIWRELRHIEAHPLKLRHVILIDDARLFTGESGYPTLAVVQAWASAQGFTQCVIANDMIRIAA